MSFRITKYFVVLIVCMLLNACSMQSTEITDVPADTNISWPPPPQAERIRYLESFDEPTDLGIRPSVFRKFMDALAGQKETGMARPYAVAVYQQKTLVADPGLHAVHLFDQARRSYMLISVFEDEALESPVGVALGKDRIFVSDSVLGKVFILDNKGQLLTSITELERPTGLVFDTVTNRLYVADTLSHQVVVFDEDGRKQFAFGNRGSGDGEFNFPSHIFMSAGQLLVNDNMNFRIQAFDGDGAFQSSFGNHGDGSGSFSQPKGVAADSDGNIYVAGATIDRIQVFSPQGEFLLAFGGKGNGAGQFLMPAGITIRNNRIYVADSYNRRIQVFEYVGGD